MRCFEGRRDGLEAEESSRIERPGAGRSCRNLTDMAGRWELAWTGTALHCTLTS